MPDDPKDLSDLMPKHPIMVGAWVGSLEFLLSRDDMMDQFRSDTGQTWKPSNIPIARMIDDAVGLPLRFFRALAVWHNEHVWGMANGKVMDIGNMPAGDWTPEPGEDGPSKDAV